MKLLAILFVNLFILSFAANSQSKVMGFSDAESKINNFHQLDDIYKSAVHSESQLAVFKSQEEQDKHTAAYYHMLKEMGVFLKDNGFQWEQETRCFNRIYFSPTGNVDYFLFQFPPIPYQKISKMNLQHWLKNS